VADVYLFMLVRWGRHLSPPAWSRPRLRAHWLRLAALPAVAQALEVEGLLDAWPPEG
jgi:glutathione S-transferase